MLQLPGTLWSSRSRRYTALQFVLYWCRRHTNSQTQTLLLALYCDSQRKGPAYRSESRSTLDQWTWRGRNTDKDVIDWVDAWLQCMKLNFQIFILYCFIHLWMNVLIVLGDEPLFNLNYLSLIYICIFILLPITCSNVLCNWIYFFYRL